METEASCLAHKSWDVLAAITPGGGGEMRVIVLTERVSLSRHSVAPLFWNPL